MPDREEWGKESWRDDNNWIFEEQAARADRLSGRVPGGPHPYGGCGTCIAILVLVLTLLVGSVIR